MSKAYVVLQRIEYDRYLPSIDGHYTKSSAKSKVDKFVAIRKRKKDALMLALAKDGCYVKKVKL